MATSIINNGQQCELKHIKTKLTWSAFNDTVSTRATVFSTYRKFGTKLLEINLKFVLQSSGLDALVNCFPSLKLWGNPNYHKNAYMFSNKTMLKHTNACSNLIRPLNINTGPNLDLLFGCSPHSWKLCKALFSCKMLRKKGWTEGGKIFGILFFLQKPPFSVNIRCYPKFLDEAL